MLHALQMTILINHAYGDITTTAMLKTGILKMPRIEMTLELFEIRTICALISQKKIIIMKIQKSIFTLLVFAASTLTH